MTGGVPPFTLSPRSRQQRTKFAAIVLRAQQYATTREARGHGALASSPGGGLRPASRGSAKPAPTTPPPANLTPTNPRIANRAESRGHGAPVSDRHRWAKPSERRIATRAESRGRLGERRPPVGTRGSAKPAPTTPPPANLTARNAGLRPASRGSAKPAPTTPPPANLTARSAGLRPASRGSAKPAPTTPPPANLTARSAGLRPASRGSAKPAPTTPPPPISRPGAPASDRHRAAARNQHQRLRAPPISRPGTPVPTGIARQRETRTNDSARRQSHGLERRSPTGIARQRETRTNDSARRQSHGLERRSPTGIARQRETRTNNGLRAPPISRPGAPVSDRHRAAARNPHQRLRAPPISRPGAPVSDRHRAAARNPHQRLRAPPISRPGAPVSDRHRAAARNPHQRRWPPQSHGGAPVSDRHRAAARNPHRRRWPSFICRQRPSFRCRLTTGAPGALRYTEGWRREFRPPLGDDAGLETGAPRVATGVSSLCGGRCRPESPHREDWPALLTGGVIKVPAGPVPDQGRRVLGECALLPCLEARKPSALVVPRNGREAAVFPWARPLAPQSNDCGPGPTAGAALSLRHVDGLRRSPGTERAGLLPPTQPVLCAISPRRAGSRTPSGTPGRSLPRPGGCGSR